MAVLYIASDVRGAGKTALCVALARDLASIGKRVALFKPLGEQPLGDKPLGEPDGPPPDTGNEVFRRFFEDDEVGDQLGIGGKRLTAKVLESITTEARRLTSERDVLLVEGATGLSDQGASRLVAALDARVVVVSRYRPDLGAPDLARWQKLFGARTVGFVINGVTRHRSSDLETRLLPSIESQSLNSLGVIPEDRRLLGVTVGWVADRLNGRFLTGEEFADGLVEHFLVGGLGLDSGELYFGLRENKAVIVRGDRPDIQMSALATRMKCMVLTYGIEPIEYVLNEAELEQVPAILVESDTMATMASLSDATRDSPLLDHPAKADRVAELVAGHVDLASIYAGLDLSA